MKNFAIKYGLWFHLLGALVFALLGAFSSWIDKNYLFLYVLFIIALLIVWYKVETIWLDNRGGNKYEYE